MPTRAPWNIALSAAKADVRRRSFDRLAAALVGARDLPFAGALPGGPELDFLAQELTAKPIRCDSKSVQPLIDECGTRPQRVIDAVQGAGREMSNEQNGKAQGADARPVPAPRAQARRRLSHMFGWNEFRRREPVGLGDDADQAAAERGRRPAINHFKSVMISRT